MSGLRVAGCFKNRRGNELNHGHEERGGVDRPLRIVVGVAPLGTVFLGPWMPLELIGLIPLVTGLAGWCPAYTLSWDCAAAHQEQASHSSPSVTQCRHVCPDVDPGQSPRRAHGRSVARRGSLWQLGPATRLPVSDGDWRNRDPWDGHAQALNDTVNHFNMKYAPWTLVAGKDEQRSRVQVLRTFCERIEDALAAGWDD